MAAKVESKEVAGNRNPKHQASRRFYEELSLRIGAKARLEALMAKISKKQLIKLASACQQRLEDIEAAELLVHKQEAEKSKARQRIAEILGNANMTLDELEGLTPKPATKPALHCGKGKVILYACLDQAGNECYWDGESAEPATFRALRKQRPGLELSDLRFKPGSEQQLIQASKICSIKNSAGKESVTA